MTEELGEITMVGDRSKYCPVCSNIERVGTQFCTQCGAMFP